MFSFLMIIIFYQSVVFTQSGTDISLPTPVVNGGKPLMDCLLERKSSRDFSKTPIPIQILSDLLWGAYGINRTEEGKHTAPTARNWQDIEIYVIIPSGVYRYESTSHELKLLKIGDHSKTAGRQDFVSIAPLNIIIVSNFDKMGEMTVEDKKLYAGIHAGAVMQNIYLYCASVGLNTVARRLFNHDELAKIINLSSNKQIILTQTVGYK